MKHQVKMRDLCWISGFCSFSGAFHEKCKAFQWKAQCFSLATLFSEKRRFSWKAQRKTKYLQGIVTLCFLLLFVEPRSIGGVTDAHRFGCWIPRVTSGATPDFYFVNRGVYFVSVQLQQAGQTSRHVSYFTSRGKQECDSNPGSPTSQRRSTLPEPFLVML